MVLENPTPNGPSSFEDSTAPSSDQDPYSSPQTKTEYSIDTLSFPKPIPILGPLLGYNDALAAKVLRGKIVNAQVTLNRPLSQEEAQAFAYWTYKQIAIFSYGSPFGIAGGLYRAYGTSATFRFPFYQPNMEKLMPNIFPSAKMVLLRGNRAVLMWHGLRALAYGTAGNYISEIFFGSYSMSVAAIGELGDSRLKGFRESLNREITKGRGQKLPGGFPRPTEQGKAQQGPSAMPIQSQTQDGASPTGGSYEEEVAGYGNSANGPMDDENLGQEEHRRRQWPQPQTSNPPPLQVEQPERSFLEFDDASPTGGLGISNDTSQQQEPRQGGSAWDRVRNSAKSGGDKKPSAWAKVEEPKRQPGQSAWSKYQTSGQESMEGSAETGSFSKSEEERSYVKQQAQKEFDAQVDRERQGGDFNIPSGSNRRL